VPMRRHEAGLPSALDGAANFALASQSRGNCRGPEVLVCLRPAEPHPAETALRRDDRRTRSHVCSPAVSCSTVQLLRRPARASTRSSFAASGRRSRHRGHPPC